MKNMITVLFWIFVIYISFAGAMFMAQRDFMYFPSHMKPAVDDVGVIGLEEITVNTADGLTLYGWYKSPDVKGKPVIAWMHGNGSNVGWSTARAIPYIKAGYGLLSIEYRGYSGNPGEPTEEGLYSDARAFITWLKEQGYEDKDIILYGESLGSGPAVKMAMEYPDLHALVLEAPFTSTVEVAARAYPIIPVSLLLKDRYDNLSRINSIKTKLIVAHGDADRVVPYILGEKLFNAAPEPKTLITIGGAGHNDLDEYDITGKILAALEGSE